MTSKVRTASIVFKRRGNTYLGSLSLRDLSLLGSDPAETMRVATEAYSRSIREMVRWSHEVRLTRQRRLPLSAAQAWDLGDIVYRLTAELAAKGSKVSGPYNHFAHHAHLPKSQVSRCTTFRKYVTQRDLIPNDLIWNEVRDAIVAASVALTNGAAGKESD